MHRIKTILAKLCRGFIWLLGKQPLKAHYFWARIISWFLQKILHYRQDVICTNLAWAFPEKKYKELKKIEKRFYDHLSEIMVEFFWFGASSARRIACSSIAEIENPQQLSELQSRGKAVMILNSHCGNWEITGGLPYFSSPNCSNPINKDNIYVVYKKLSSEVADKIFYSNRCYPVSGYKGCVESADLPRAIVRHKNDPCFFLVNNDQFAWHACVDVGTFLNKQTKAFVATAQIAHKLGLPVVFMKMDNDRTGHYVITFQTITEDASLMSAEDITKKYMSLLEAQIVENPANWLWSHKRWK